MTRREWLAQFDASLGAALDAVFDALVEQILASGGTLDDLDELDARWRVEVEEQVRPLRMRALRALQAVPDEAIVWD